MKKRFRISFEIDLDTYRSYTETQFAEWIVEQLKGDTEINGTNPLYRAKVKNFPTDRLHIVEVERRERKKKRVSLNPPFQPTQSIG